MSDDTFKDGEFVERRKEPTPIDALTKQLSNIHKDLGAVNADAEDLRKSVAVVAAKTRLYRIILAVMAFMLAITAFTALQNWRNGEVVRDCVTPAGECNQRNQRSTAEVVQTIKFANEAERLITEISVARLKGDTIAVDERERRLGEVNAALARSAERLQAIQRERDQAAQE